MYALIYAILYRGLSIHQFWCPVGEGERVVSWNQFLINTQGQLFSGSQKVYTDFSVQGTVSLTPTLYVYPPDLSGLDPSVRLYLEVLFKIITDKVSVFKQISCIFVFSGRYSSTTWKYLNMGPKEP